jgi:hypothetical protein
MKFPIDSRIVSLANGQKYWFSSSVSPNNFISRIVSPSVEGVYCIWWKEPTTFPAAKTVELPAGKRGVISVALKSCRSELTENIALYVGKGAVRTRLASHVKPVRSTDNKKSRNPYEWLSTVFPGTDLDCLIRDNLGFSFIQESNKLEQIYAENLAIGILRPWFNIRLTA